MMVCSVFRYTLLQPEFQLDEKTNSAGMGSHFAPSYLLVSDRNSFFFFNLVLGFPACGILVP